MRVTHQDIADKLGLSRTTVTKIINRDPNYGTSDELRRRVYEVAEELGYDFSQIRRPFRRRYGRADVDVSADVSLVLDDGTVFDSGTAKVTNICEGGVFLTDVKLGKGSLPLKSFQLKVRIRAIDQMEGVTGTCELVRFDETDKNGAVQLGMRFTDIAKKDRKRIQAYVSQFGDDPKRAPLQPKH